MIIVTGGAGFIGSNLVRSLNRLGIDDILIVDSLEHGEKHRNLNSLGFRDFIDYEDFLRLRKRFNKGEIEAVFHQGAYRYHGIQWAFYDAGELRIQQKPVRVCHRP